MKNKKRIMAAMHIGVAALSIAGVLVVCGFTAKTSSNFNYAVAGGTCASQNGGCLAGSCACAGSTCSNCALSTCTGCFTGCFKFF